MIIYGVGAHLDDMLKWHPDLAQKIERIIDKDETKIGKKVEKIDKVIEAPDQLEQLPQGSIIYISAIRYYDEIKREIAEINPGLVCKNIDEFYHVQNKDVIDPQSVPNFQCVDVLFVNGCPIHYTYRYRVAHPREQLAAVGMSSEDVYYEALTDEWINYCRVIIIYRCPVTEKIREFISLAKRRHKKVFFSVDDLIIDTKYTDTIPQVMAMEEAERTEYDTGVKRYRETMQLCDGVITTTEGLARELGNYMKTVFINPNVASGTMVEKSLAVSRRTKGNIWNEQVTLGYFSGSRTHDDDMEMMVGVLRYVFETYPQVKLLLVGEIVLPDALNDFSSRVEIRDFVSWLELPELIASVDINLAPLRQTIFNECKSANKWMEAALVKVPTVASRIGDFEKNIIDGETGFLCTTEAEWKKALSELIENEGMRRKIGLKAQKYVLKHCTTMETGNRLKEFIKKQWNRNAAFVLPSFELSGGILVAIKHAAFLHGQGWDITFVNYDTREDAPNLIKNMLLEFSNFNFHKTLLMMSFDVAVATMWFTTRAFEAMSADKEIYLVQNFEPDFYGYDCIDRYFSNATYHHAGWKYITISSWCEQWLANTYGQHPTYVKNGLDINMFPVQNRSWDGRLIILIEGDSKHAHKNVDEAFEIVATLPRDKFAVWYVSYNGEPKPWYRVDKFFNRVPYSKMPKIYQQCHILLKTSVLESFSYPPLEMMATGGTVVVRPNEGNAEYIVDGKNCLTYDGEDLYTAVQAIQRIAEDKTLRNKLIEGGIETARQRDWKNFEKDIIAAYAD